MERVPFAVLLIAGSVVVVVRQWRLWSARRDAATRWDRVRTGGAPAYAVCCALTAALGVVVIVSAVTRTGAALIGVLITTTAAAVVATAVVFAVLWWRERRRRPSPPAVGIRPVPPAPAEDWVPPTAQAAAMLEGRRGGDPSAICSALAMEPLHLLVAREDAERWFTEGPCPLPARGRRTPDGRFHLVAYTECGRPETLPEDLVLRPDGLDGLLATLDEEGTLEVDPGRPQQVTVELAALRRWSVEHPDQLGRHRPDRLRALQPVETTGTLAHGLACAAWHAVMNGYPWNRFGPAGYDALDARVLMRDGWGIGSARDWQQMLDRLADPQPFGGDVVFGLRRRIGEGTFVPAGAVEAVVEDPENVELNGRAVSDEVLADLRRTEAYEGYLRERGVLAEWEQVHSLLAWDIGRGAMLARYGLDARYCDESTARWQLERFGLLARRCYDSWPDFGAALVLGRLLWTADLDDADLDRYGVEAETCVRPFTVLTSEPTSPWRTVPFHPSVPAEPASAPSEPG